MASYSYKCESCDRVFEKQVPRNRFAEPQPCGECGRLGERIIGAVSFVLSGDGWVGKNQKIKGQMARKNMRLNGKSRERRHDAPGMKLAPNVNGERVESWDEAAKLAGSKGLDADTYETKAREARADS
jgi:putative FmdB family regulatory protein